MTDMIANGEALTADAIRDFVRTGGYRSYTVGQLVKDYLAILSKRVDVDLSMGTYQKYVLVRNMFFKYIGPEEECTAITPALIKRVQVDLYAKYDMSTAAGYLTKLKTLINFGIDNNRIKVNPFQNIKINKGKRKIIYLTESEIRKINDLQIDNESLANVRDAFLLQASTGLAYCDVYGLKREDIHITEDGTHYIRKERQKTGNPYTCVVLPMGVEVLKRHNYQLHIISNQKMNAMLKIIQVLSGVTTTLTTHVARRSYATYLLNHGVRIETVSHSLGHASVKITQAAYAAFLNDTVIKEIKEKI